MQLFLACFLLAALILPLIRMFMNLAQADFAKIITRPDVLQAIARSVFVAVTATAISVSLAMAIAWCMTRTAVRAKGVFGVLLLIPMLIPSISQGMGLILLFGSNGSVTNLLGMDHGLYGFWGIVTGSVLYSFPVAYLMIADVLRYEDSTPYEAASVLGIPPARRLFMLTLPYLRKPLINVVFATFTLIVTDYGVPLMVGGMYKTLPVLMYEEVIGRQDFAQGSVFGVILLLPAVAAFFVDLFCRGRASSTFVRKPFDPKPSRVRDALAFAFLSLSSAAVCLPIVAFAQITFATRYPRDMTFTFHNIVSSVEKGALRYLGNSLTIACLVALLGSTLAFFCAYCSARTKSRLSSSLHMMAITSLAVPGIVLGLSYAMLFKGTVIYSTMAILVLVNTVHFFSSPYLMMYNSMGKMNAHLENVGATLGISRMRMLRDVFLPQTRATLFEMASYFFVNSMMTISAVAFLATAKTRPISLMINQFEAQTLLEASAFVSLLILAANLLMKAAIYQMKRKWK